MARTAGGKVGTVYFKGLTGEVPELLVIATRKETRHPELDTSACGVHGHRRMARTGG
jgi:hypothetical protein